MSSLVAVVVFLFVLGNAINQIQRQRRLGLAFQWGKTFATGGGCVLVTLVALGALLLAMHFDAPVLGAIACAVLLAGGLTGLIVWVNRTWPRREGE